MQHGNLVVNIYDFTLHVLCIHLDILTGGVLPSRSSQSSIVLRKVELGGRSFLACGHHHAAAEGGMTSSHEAIAKARLRTCPIIVLLSLVLRESRRHLGVGHKFRLRGDCIT